MNRLKKEESSPGPTPTSLTRNISSPSKKYRAKPLTKGDVTSHESLFYWRKQYEDMVHYMRESGVTTEEADEDEVRGHGRGGRKGGREWETGRGRAGQKEGGRGTPACFFHTTTAARSPFTAEENVPTLLAVLTESAVMERIDGRGMVA